MSCKRRIETVNLVTAVCDKRIDGLLVQETEGRGRLEALCYEDILMMMVGGPETGQMYSTSSQGGAQRTPLRWKGLNSSCLL